jgi:hypothetical protein
LSGLEFGALYYFENTKSHFDLFLGWIKHLMEQLGMDKVIIGMEPTGQKNDSSVFKQLKDTLVIHVNTK